MSDEGAFEARAAALFGDILGVLSEVSAGQFASRLPEMPDGDPFQALFRGINETIAHLADARADSEQTQRQLEEKLRTIDQQAMAIRELSTPVIEVWSGVLCLPIVGVLDTARSAEMTQTLLEAIAAKKSRCAIIDVTGIEVMDTATVDYFLRMARAIRLLGADCVISGIRPNIAMTIVQMGVDLTGILTKRTLRDALAPYVVKPAG